MTTLESRATVPHFNGTIGVARRDITPPLGIRAKNWGPAKWEAAEGIHRSMTLSAVAFGAAEAGLVTLLLAVDATCWRQVNDEWKFRSSVLEALNLAPEQLMINLSHTHSGPALGVADSNLTGGEFIAEYLELMSSAAIDAGRSALDGAREGRVEWVVGKSSLASNRELVLDGRALVGYNPYGLADDTVLVGRVTDNDDTILAVLVNYACHPTTLAWKNRLISPDYVGAMREVIEDRTSAPCVFLQGASGDLAPREQYSGDTALADRHGRSLGHAVLAALESLPTAGRELELTSVVESGAVLAVWEPAEQKTKNLIRAGVGHVEIEFAELPPFDVLEARWAEIDQDVAKERLSRERKRREGYAIGPTVEYPVWVWQIGDAIFVGHPGEAYSRFQRTLRERFPNTTIIVMNLTNGPGFVYLPTIDAYERGAYQAWQTLFKAGSLERLEAHAVDRIEQLIGGEL